MNPPLAGVLTVSDRCARAQAADTAGPAVARLLEEHAGCRIAARHCVPDDADNIAQTLQQWVNDGLDIIATTGGTGLSPRDVTPEAAARLIQRPWPGLMELARARTGATFPRAYLSRGIAGIANRSIIFTLPGSEKAAREQLEAFIDLLPHAVHILRGGDHPPAGA
ncbi:MAG: MogA/MoaB family molybdenum cofactor biosynthesis protein [Phycisphaeraceae bacterium]|nr:MogA/MoaB family molybdenum cofactor biosynthesis protein [Phycisphaeraceae bacterium]